MKSLTKRQSEILNFIRSFYIENGYSPSYREIADHFGLSSVATVAEHISTLKLKGYLEAEPTKARALQISTTLDDIPALVRLMGFIAAGKPIEAIRTDKTIEIPKDMMEEDVYALQVKGDSMITDGILSGDYVIVKQSNTANNGDIVVALLENQYATLKRFYKEKGRVRLQPASPRYSPIYVKKVNIQGVVKGVIRKFSKS